MYRKHGWGRVLFGAIVLAIVTVALCVGVLLYATLGKRSAEPVTINVPEEPALPTVKEYLRGALEPAKGCLYIWGGGWNGGDPSEEAVSFGPSPRWKELFDRYGVDYEPEAYLSHDGLDCTGFLGYSVYQVFGDRYSNNGYVAQSGTVGLRYQYLFGSAYIPFEKVVRHHAGDVMFRDGHVWISLGECGDGSVLLIHASPPNVTLAGTPTPDGNYESQAVALAQRYMRLIAPDAIEKFPYTCTASESFLTDYNSYSFPETVMIDPEGLRNMSADDVMRVLTDT